MSREPNFGKWAFFVEYEMRVVHVAWSVLVEACFNLQLDVGKAKKALIKLSQNLSKIIFYIVIF